MLLIFIAWLPHAAKAAGVTIITHGFDSDVNGWVTAMAEQITNYASFPGTNSTTYQVTLTTDGTDYFYQWERAGGEAPSNTDSGEIIVKLDWSQMAGTDDPLDDPYDTSTYIVAEVASYVLLQTNIISELDGRALVEYPIHLVGHSRGGSLMNQISLILGTNGVWVDHLTTLDPHPFNNDGNDDFLYPTDASASNTWANVLFRDNYWQDIGSGTDPDGEPAAGAYNRHLTELDEGYNYTDLFSPYHSNVHLWYYGTIDWNTPASYDYPNDDDSATIDAWMRSNWWSTDEGEGTNAGFEYSLIGGANRVSTEEPAGPGLPSIVDGYNQRWDFGAGNSTNRTVLPANNGTWPNIIKFDVTSTNVITAGSLIETGMYYQYAGNSNLTFSIWFDRDFNPYNGNSTLVQEWQAGSTGAGSVDYYANLALTTTNVPPGVYAIYGRVSDGAHTRYLYTQELVEIVSNQQPGLGVAKLNSGRFVVSVNGVSGQTIVLEASADLHNWLGVATNTLASSNWSYTNGIPPNEGQQFYRAVLAP
jgi:hypothetical protein